MLGASCVRSAGARDLRILLILGSALLVLASAGDARAHGGNFRRGTPNPGRPAQPPGTEPPRLPGPTTPGAGPGIGNPLDPARYGWATWWRLNAEAWDLPRGVFLLRGRIAVTPSEVAPQTDADDDGADLEPARIHRLLVERARARVVLPHLRRLVDPATKAPPELVAAALIAWARMATDTEVVPVLQRLATDPRATLEVRESAVLGLGLLRRSAPSRQLSTAELTSVRDFLLARIDARDHPVRVRTWAAYALGLLGDQPFGDGAQERCGRRITEALWQRIRKDPRAPVALLVALGMQPPEGVPDDVLAELRQFVLTGRPLWSNIQQAHALHAYVRLLPDDRVRVLHYVLTRPRTTDPVRMTGAAANALAETAPTLTATQRRDVVRWLGELVPAIEDPRAAGLGVLALGALLGADLRDGSTVVLEETEVADTLLRTAREGDRALRPYAALALAVAARGDRLTSRPAAVFRTEVAKALAEGVARTRGADEVVTPHVTAAGLARAEAARPELLRILANKHRFSDIRGHAARALGLLGRPDARTLELLLAATRDRVDPFVQGQAVRALGMLAAPGACDELLDQLRRADPRRGVAVSVALALGRLGDPKAADRLVLLAEDEQAGLRVRTMAVVALGLIFDPESPPSRARLRTFADYLSPTRDYVDVLGIL